MATGQVASQTTRHPTIMVWDSQTLETLSILKGFHQRGVCALSFGLGNEPVVASVGLDDNNSVAIYDWKKGTLLADARGHSDRIFEIEFSPAGGLVTCGVKHVKFWEWSGAGLKGRAGTFGKAPIQTMLCIAFSSRGDCFTGALSGDVYQWSGGNCTQVIAKAHDGPTYAITAAPQGRGYLTAGKDGKIRVWDDRFQATSRDIKLDVIMSDGAPPTARAIEWIPEQGRILLATATSDILEIDEKSGKFAYIMSGHHEGEAWALATHPSAPLFATGSDDKTVRIFDMATRRQVFRIPNEEVGILG